MNDAAVLGGHDPLLGCNFKIAKPTLEQKCWMVQLVISKVETVASLAKRCSFSRKNLHKMVVRHLKGLPLRLKSGRPRVLDVISHEIIGASIQNNACSDRAVLNQSISDEYTATRIRRCPPTVEEIANDGRDVKVPRRSLKRYARRLHPELFLNDETPPEFLPYIEESYIYWS